jgi:hypothetical protein
MRLRCLHCAVEIDSRASICPLCHTREPFRSQKMNFSQSAMAIGNITKAVATLAIAGTVLYFILKAMMS